MDSNFLNRKSFSLLEVSLGLVVIVLLLCVSCIYSKGIISNAKATQSTYNLDAIGQACRQYYMRSGQWPSLVSDLQPYFLNSNVGGSRYTLNPQLNILTVSSGTYSITITKPRGLAGWLDFKN